MANNPLLFNAAYCAAIGAGEAGRLINSTNAADYAEVKAAALVFATALDNAIPFDASTSSADADLMLSCCLSVLFGRYSLATSSYAQIVQGITALYQAARSGAASASDTYDFDDDFDGTLNSIGTLTSTTGQNMPTGSGNWNVRAIQNTGSYQGSSPILNHPGCMRWFTGNVANDAWVVTKNQLNLNLGSIFAENISEMQFIALVQNTSNTNVQMKWFAATLDASFDPTSNLMEFKFDTSLSNNLLLTAGATPAINSGFDVTAVANQFFKMKFIRTSSDVKFFINDTLAGTAPTPPSGLVSTGFRCKTLTGAARFMTMDQCHLKSTPLVR